MTQIGGGRFDRFLRNLFNIKALPIAPSLTPEISASIAVEAEDAPELDFLRSFQRWSGYDAQGAAGAGVLSQVTIRNATPDYIIIVDGFEIDTGGASLTFIGFDALPAGAVSNNFRTFTDGREVLQIVTRRPVAQLFHSANVGSALTQGVTLTSRTTPLAPSVLPWIIGPQQNLIFENASANTTLQLIAWGRSRPIEPTED